MFFLYNSALPILDQPCVNFPDFISGFLDVNTIARPPPTTEPAEVPRKSDFRDRSGSQSNPGKNRSVRPFRDLEESEARLGRGDMHPQSVKDGRTGKLWSGNRPGSVGLNLLHQFFAPPPHFSQFRKHLLQFARQTGHCAGIGLLNTLIHGL